MRAQTTTASCRQEGERRRRRPPSPLSPDILMPGFQSLSTLVLLLILSVSVSSFGVVSTPLHGRREVSLSLSSSQSRTNGQQQHVVIVGGGVGGLATAARIASEQKNAKITLLEKNDRIGGRCGSFWVDPENSGDPEKMLFRHEEGPSLLLLQRFYQEVFLETTMSSKTASDYGLDMVQCAPAYQIVFDDGDRIPIGFPEGHNDPQAEASSRAQMDSYEPNGAQKWDDYMATTVAYLDAGLPNFIEEKLDLGSLPEFLVRSLQGFGKAWPLKPHSDVLDALFESNKLRALASFQDLYVGLEPYKNPKLIGGGVFQSTAPAVFGLLAAIELHPSNKNAGVFAPVGGFRAVSNALEALAVDLGVEIRCETNVLGVTNDGVWATDSQKDGKEFIPADLIIVNADLPYAKNSLLLKSDKDTKTNDLTDKFDWDDSFSFSSGVISFYWSLDKPLADLNTHNVFLSTKSRSDAEASWQVLREPHTTPPNTNDDSDHPFNFYVHRPSHTDPSAAPPGCDTIMVLVPCRTLLRDEEYALLSRDQAMVRYQQQFTPEVVAQARRAVLKRFAAVDSLRNLENHILHEEYRTPATWADKYNLGAGTPFALVCFLRVLVFFGEHGTVKGTNISHIHTHPCKFSFARLTRTSGMNKSIHRNSF